MNSYSYSTRNKTIDFFKKETAYEVRISDWSSDVCSSDLFERHHGFRICAGVVAELFDQQGGDGRIFEKFVNVHGLNLAKIERLDRSSKPVAHRYGGF